MRDLLKLWLFFVLVLIYGCGGEQVISNTDPGPTMTSELTIVPAPLVVALGEQRTLQVLVEPETRDVTTEATLTSSDPSVLRVDGPGQVTGVSPGTVTLTATFAGNTATSAATVTNAVLASVKLSPTTARVMGEFQFGLVGTFSDGKTTELTLDAEWSSDDPAILTVEKGLARTAALGSTRITGTYNGLTATQAVTTVGGARLVSFNGTNSAAGNDNSALDRQGLTATPNVLQRQISSDGRFIVFSSSANDLLPPGSPAVDMNNRDDVYVRDLATNTNILVSVDATGMQSGNDTSEKACITPDGRFVFFHSRATDLTAVAPPFPSQIYRRDLQFGTTEIVSLNGDAAPKASNGAVALPNISGDGNVVVFTSTATNFPVTGSGAVARLIARNLATGEVEVVNLDPAGSLTMDPGRSLYSVNQDGRFVVFNVQLPPSPPTNPFGSLSILLRDLQSDSSTLISTDSQGNSLGLARAPLINGEGTKVLFAVGQEGPLRTGTYAKDLASGALTFITSVVVTGASDDFRFLVGRGGDFLLTDFGLPYLVDATTGATTRLDVETDGVLDVNFFAGSLFGSLPTISGNGARTAFGTLAPLDPIVTGNDFQVYETDNPLLP